jgi:hypothetical protein
MQTVVGNEAFVTDLAKNAPGLDVYGLNPGMIQTEIRNRFLGAGTWKSFFVESMVGLLCKSAETYAEKTLLPLMANNPYRSKTLIDAEGGIVASNPYLLEKDHQDRFMKESNALIDRGLNQ